MLQLRIQYYFPRRIDVKLSFRYLIQLNRAIVKNNMISHVIKIEITRITSPCLDSSILSQFFTYITIKYNFRQICIKIEEAIIYRYFKSARVSYQEKDSLQSRDQVLGIDISLNGRIPREPVRPRKTIQHKMLGKRSIRLVNRSIFLTNRAQGVNPELGAFSIWIRIIILCLILSSLIVDKLNNM